MFSSLGAVGPEIRPDSSRQVEKVVDGWQNNEVCPFLKCISLNLGIPWITVPSRFLSLDAVPVALFNIRD
jgi:hypothetical protein